MRGPGPPAQFLHHDDLIDAVHLAITSRLDGVYNVAPDGSIPHERPAGAGGAPAACAVAMGRRADAWVGWRGRPGWSRRRQPSRPTSSSHGSSPTTALRAAGWEPQHTNEEAFVASAEPSAFQDMSVRRRQQLTLRRRRRGPRRGGGRRASALRASRRVTARTDCRPSGTATDASAARPRSRGSSRRFDVAHDVEHDHLARWPAAQVDDERAHAR